MILARRAQFSRAGRLDAFIVDENSNCVKIVSMAVKAVVADEDGTRHLIIGLNRENVNAILQGDVFTLPRGYLQGLSEQSDVVVLFAETDKDVETRFPPSLRPV